jgi:hypothetical protein
MRTTILVLCLVIVVLLMLLWWENKSSRQKDVDRQRVEYSLARYANAQATLRIKSVEKIAEKDSLLIKAKKDSTKFVVEISSLKRLLEKRRTAAVVKVIEREPDMAAFLEVYDSIVAAQDARIDSAEIERQMIVDVYEEIVVYKDSLIQSKDSETLFLREDNNRLYDENKMLEKKVKRRTLAAILLFLGNLVPR